MAASNIVFQICVCGFLQSFYHILWVCKSFPSTIINLLQTGSLFRVHRSQLWQKIQIPQKAGGKFPSPQYTMVKPPKFLTFLTKRFTFQFHIPWPHALPTNLIHSLHTWDGCLRSSCSGTPWLILKSIEKNRSTDFFCLNAAWHLTRPYSRVSSFP